MQLIELTDPLANLPIKVVEGTDGFISSCEGIDHLSFGDSRSEAFENFIITLRMSQQDNTREVFESMFTDSAI